jgi:F0F1-type ATP synthase delta subunit
MKFSSQQYARAFCDIAENKKGADLKTATKKCADFLSKTGDTAKSREIIAEIQKISDNKNKIERIHLESSEKPDSESLKKNFKKGTIETE